MYNVQFFCITNNYSESNFKVAKELFKNANSVPLIGNGQCWFSMIVRLIFSEYCSFISQNDRAKYRLVTDDIFSKNRTETYTDARLENRRKLENYELVSVDKHEYLENTYYVESKSDTKIEKVVISFLDNSFYSSCACRAINNNSIPCWHLESAYKAYPEIYTLNRWFFDDRTKIFCEIRQCDLGKGIHKCLIS